jgi:2Fe-2S ferredoxin
MQDTIHFYVELEAGNRMQLEAPTDMGLTVMEVIKAHELDIQALCGGMALCATCHVQVKEGQDTLPPIGDAEADMLDTLPHVSQDSRLSCQLRVSESLAGAVFRILGNSN